MRIRAAAAGLAGVVLVLATAGCGTILPSRSSAPATPGPPLVPEPKPGPVDLALFGVDPFLVLRSVQGGKACRQGALTGSTSGNGTFHALSDYTCPRLGDDRNVYFLFVDAYEAALRDAGAAVPGHGGEMGDASEPMSTVWTLHGNTFSGTARIIGDNGPGTLRLFVSMDLLAP